MRNLHGSMNGKTRRNSLKLNRDRMEYYLDLMQSRFTRTNLQLKERAAKIRNKKQQEKTLKTAELLLRGAVIYELYGKRFQKTKYYEDIVFNQSNLLFDIGEHEKAGKLFSFLGKRENSKYKKDAAYNAVMAAYNRDSQEAVSQIAGTGSGQEAGSHYIPKGSH